MAKTIGLHQLEKKVYNLVQGLPVEFLNSIGEIDDAWDCIIYGASGNGKSNFTVMLLKALIQAMNCKCEYVSYEEGHSKTVQDTWIRRHNMLEAVGNKLQITDHLTYAELDKKIGKKQSAKIWVIDSVQAGKITYHHYHELKRKYVLSRKKKILIFISWADGDKPKGADAKNIEYDCQVKILVDKLIAFPKSRFGGNQPFVIWEKGAKAKWGRNFYKKAEIERPKREKKEKAPKEPETIPAAEPVTNIQLLPEETTEEKQEAIIKQLKAS
jgi:hypothetical protein